MKKLKSIILASALIFCMILVADAVEISDFSEITDLGGSYELAGDVVIDESFSPVGSENQPFTGTFDGKGHTVSGGSYSSIFAVTNGAEIKNLNVTGVTVVSGSAFGGIAGKAKGGTVIENCFFDGILSVETEGMYGIGGGIAGIVEKRASVINCGAKVTLTVSKKPYLLSVGGIAGQNSGTVKLCMSEGTLSATSDKYRVNLGGIAGENMGYIEGCFNNAAITGSVGVHSAVISAGGIAGYNNEGTIERTANLAQISGVGMSLYPAYIGGITGMNVNGTVDISKNGSRLNSEKSFAGGIAGFNLGHKGLSRITDVLNTGLIFKNDSITGGITAVNSETSEENSKASVQYALNLAESKSVSKNGGDAGFVYSTGETDGISQKVTEDELKENGIQTLEQHEGFWVNNTVISALPDLLVVSDTEKSQLVVSNMGDDGRIAYYLYSPEGVSLAKSFTAAFYEGTRYIGMSYVEATPTETYARLIADKIPENTTRIKFIAFAGTLGTFLKPAEVKSVEIAYSK